MDHTEMTPAQQMAEALNQRARRLRENRHLWTDTRIVGTWASGRVAIVDAAALKRLRDAVADIGEEWSDFWALQDLSPVVVIDLLASAQTAEEETA